MKSMNSLANLIHHCDQMPRAGVSICWGAARFDSEDLGWCLFVERVATENDLQENHYLEEVGDTPWTTAVEIRCRPYCGDELTYGSVLALLSPLGASSNVSEITNWVGIGSAATPGLYNAIELSDGKYSKNEILMKNVYGWHGLVLIFGVTEWLTGEEVSNDNVALFPVENGLVISMNYQF